MIQIVCEEYQYCRPFNKSFEQDCTIAVSMLSSSEVAFHHFIDDTMTFSSSFFRRHSKLPSSSALHSNGYRLSHPSNDMLMCYDAIVISARQTDLTYSRSIVFREESSRVT